MFRVTIQNCDRNRQQNSTASIGLINDCNKYKIDLTTNGVVITDAIKFVRTNQEKLSISTKEDNGSKESKEPDHHEDKDHSKTFLTNSSETDNRDPKTRTV